MLLGAPEKGRPCLCSRSMRPELVAISWALTPEVHCCRERGGSSSDRHIVRWTKVAYNTKSVWVRVNERIRRRDDFLRHRYGLPVVVEESWTTLCSKTQCRLCHLFTTEPTQPQFIPSLVADHIPSFLTTTITITSLLAMSAIRSKPVRNTHKSESSPYVCPFHS